MKKVSSFLLVLASVLTISSCERNEVNAPDNYSKDGFRYEFVINDEGAIDESTKATLSSTGVAWEDSDRVGMFLDGYTGYANINMANDPRTVILYSTAVIPANSYAYAYYPWSDANDDKTVCKIVLPHVQSGASQSAMPLVGVPFKVEAEAAAKSGPNGVINFMNLGSIIDFKVYSADYDDEVVDYITFTATNSGAVVAGDGYLDLTAVDQNDDNTLELSFGFGDDYNNVKVHNANTAVASTKDAANSIYMVLNPGTYSGTITIGTDKATYTFNFTDKTLVRNQVKHYNMNLGNAVRGPKDLGAVSLPYNETFATDEGEFVTDGVKANNVDVWQFASGFGMKATSSFNSGNDKYDATSWLTSPWIDLTSVSAAAVSFDHVHRYAGTKENEFTLWVLTDEANSDWVKLTIPTWATGTNWNFGNSGEILLTDYVGKNVKLGFKYIGTTANAGTWEIKNFSVVEKVYTTEFTMDSDEITVEEGKTKNNNVTVNSGATITYSSDDESIATVAADGTITGVAEGDTYINVHVDANGVYPAEDDLFAVHVIPAKTAPDPETIDFSSLSLENGVAYNDPFDGGNFTVTFASGGNNGKYYTTGTAIRVYGGGSFTVASADYTIVKIELTYGSGDGSNTITTNVPTFSNSTWTGSASSVTFTVAGTSGNRRIQKIKVTYDGGGSSTPTKTLESITVTAPNKTTYSVGGTFDATGMVVTATYSDATTADVTSLATTDFTTQVASAGNKTVTVSYTEAGVTKTDTFDIIVNANTATKTLEFTYESHSGWTISSGAEDKTTYFLLKNSSYIESPSFTFKTIESIQVKMRYYGGASYGVLKSAFNNTDFGTASATTNKINNNSYYTLTLSNTPTNNTGKIKFYGSNTTDQNGPGVAEITITYTD